jgi:predicted lipoprotein with Yx(FWY)xxD motif
MFLPAVAVSLLLAACGSSSSTNSSNSPASSGGAASQTSGGAAAVVKTASNSTLGATVLVDSQGLTLYRLSGEQDGKWICTSTACLHAWHPLTAPTGASLSASIGSLATTKRPGGTTQVTFKGMPLYTFVGDTKPGDAKGQGLKDFGVWTAVSPSGTTSSKPVTSTPAPASSSGGSSYGY